MNNPPPAPQPQHYVDVDSSKVYQQFQHCFLGEGGSAN